MPSGLQGFLAALLVALLIASVFAVCFLYVNDCQFIYLRAENFMPADGSVEMQYMEDGYARFTWTENPNADGYMLRFSVTEEDGHSRVIYTEKVQNNEYWLPNLPLEKDLHIEILCYNYYRFPYQNFKRIRYSENALHISGTFGVPSLSGLTCNVDPDADTANVRFEMDYGTTARLFYREADGTLTLVAELDRGNITLQFGDGTDYPVPEYGEKHTFVLDAVSRTPGFTYYGVVCAEFSVNREDLLGTKLYLQCEDEGYNSYTLTWNETKGDHYEVQRYDEETEEWITVHIVPRDGQRTYYTGHLERYSNIRYRVVALGGQTLPDSEFAATPAEVEVETGASLLYSTIWNLVDLEVYKDPSGDRSMGTLAAGTASCILGEEDGMFLVRFQDGYGYIDSRYCMINLPDFIGDLCQYDITNSYDSLYKIHEFGIPEVTGEVTTGYENIKLAEDTYLVPLLYPTALKLEKAAFAALAEGYQIKIYDSYRPGKATLELYDVAYDMLSDPVADEIYADEETRLHLKWYDEEDTLLWYNFLQEDLKIPQDLIDRTLAAEEAAKNPVETPTDSENPEETPQEDGPPTDEEGKTLEDYRPTYQELMTDHGRYYLSNFLAYSGSRHNQGVAMDMTLVNLNTGKEVEMQTAIHDLSWYSEVELNNDNADLLKRIMLDHGFTGLRSEWWHFQDDAIREEVELPFARYGLSPRGWVADDFGWRYRLDDGSFYTDCVAEIDGVSYRFDTLGYGVATDAPAE